MTREEIIAEAIGDAGNTTRAHRALDALHNAGWRIQKPPTDAAPLALSLRERGQFKDADDVDALAMGLDTMRRGWGPTTPTERMLRRSDLISARRFLERVYDELIELDIGNYSHDGVVELNIASVRSMTVASEGMDWINDRLQQEIHCIPDRSTNERGQIDDATRSVAEGSLP